jgi:hypothetical protein
MAAILWRSGIPVKQPIAGGYVVVDDYVLCGFGMTDLVQKKNCSYLLLSIRDKHSFLPNGRLRRLRTSLFRLYNRRGMS